MKRQAFTGETRPWLATHTLVKVVAGHEQVLAFFDRKRTAERAAQQMRASHRHMQYEVREVTRHEAPL